MCDVDILFIGWILLASSGYHKSDYPIEGKCQKFYYTCMYLNKQLAIDSAKEYDLNYAIPVLQ